MTLPHTYTDHDGDEVHVDGNSITVHEKTREGGPAFAMALLPHESADAVALVKAILEATGDTGYVVTSWREYHEALRNACEEGARSMRERAAQSAEEDDIARASRIRALPLLPDEEPTEVRHITDAVSRALRVDRVPLTADTDA